MRCASGCCSPRLDLFLDNDLWTIHYPLHNMLTSTSCYRPPLGSPLLGVSALHDWAFTPGPEHPVSESMRVDDLQNKHSVLFALAVTSFACLPSSKPQGRSLKTPLFFFLASLQLSPRAPAPDCTALKYFMSLGIATH